MSQIDEDEVLSQHAQQSTEDRFHALEQHITYLTQQVQQNQQLAPQVPIPPIQPIPSSPPLPPPPPSPQPNLNLPTPPYFSGIPSELIVFRLKLYHYLMGNHNTYTDDRAQVLYAGSLLNGSADQWYASLVDPVTMRLPPHYTLASFFRAIEDFFGGGVTIDSRERSLDNLRQTGTVAELAIAFQNITNTFYPRWPNHPLIYFFSRKLKEGVRFQLTSQGSLPLIFQDYVSSAIAVEHNQAAASFSRTHSQQQALPPKPKQSLV